MRIVRESSSRRKDGHEFSGLILQSNISCGSDGGALFHAGEIELMRVTMSLSQECRGAVVTNVIPTI
jgi:hypothetical protein